jgi:hypothetical protein
MFSVAYGGEAMKNSGVSECHKRLKEVRENVEDVERSGLQRSHRSDENVEGVRNLVYSGRQVSVKSIT